MLTILPTGNGSLLWNVPNTKPPALNASTCLQSRRTALLSGHWSQHGMKSSRNLSNCKRIMPRTVRKSLGSHLTTNAKKLSSLRKASPSGYFYYASDTIFGRPVRNSGSPVLLRPGTSPQALQILPRDRHPALQHLTPAGPRGITPGFGYEPPSTGFNGTLTHLINVLPRTHYGFC